MTSCYWDAFTLIGPREYKHPAARWSLEHLCEDMEYCSISSAMVLSTQSVFFDPFFGNLELSRQLEKFPNLHPIWNVMPAIGNEFPTPKDLLRKMHEKQVKAVSIFPKTNGWDISDPSHRPLFEALAEQQIPLYLPRAEFGEYAVLRAFLESTPTLPVIVQGASWPEQRLIIPLLLRHKNLHITLDKFQVHYGPEDLVAQGLEDQLLFGTNAPTMSTGAHRCFIDYAEIPESAQQKMASGNLARLLNEPIPAPASPPAHDDILMMAAREGKPLPIPIIDMHMHILEEGMHGGGGSYRMPHGGPKGVLQLLERLGCKGGGFMSWNGTVSCDTLAGNECTRRALDVAPPGFWGLGSFDPCHYSQEELARLIPKLYEDPRFIGMKPYVRQGVPYDSALYDFWWEFGNERGLYALLHRTRQDYSEALNLARKYPRVQWIVAHCGASFETADQTIDAIRQFPNIHAEITLTPVCGGIIEYLVDGCGADRVLYGSDLPMRDPRQQLGWVVYARLPVDVKKRLLNQNALDIVSKINPRLESEIKP